MLYELRKWSESDACLYTDDSRVKDLAIRDPGLQVVASYFRALKDRTPFAWDIVGPEALVSEVAARFHQLSTKPAKPRPAAGSRERRSLAPARR
jgi:hypothetical protein